MHSIEKTIVRNSFRVFALLALAWVSLPSNPLHAGMILDFEGTGLSQGDAVGTVDGVSFTNALFVMQGNPTFAFASPFGGDTGGSGSFSQAGNGFIVAGPTGDHNQTLTMDFTTYGTVSQLSFDVVDIDTQDIFSAIAYDSEGQQLELISLNANSADPGTGDGVVTTISFTVGGIATVQTLNSRIQDAGHGIDNIAFTAEPVPEPASLGMLALGGLTLLGFRRRWRSRSHQHRRASVC